MHLAAILCSNNLKAAINCAHEMNVGMKLLRFTCKPTPSLTALRCIAFYFGHNKNTIYELLSLGLWAVGLHFVALRVNRFTCKAVSVIHKALDGFQDFL